MCGPLGAKRNEDELGGMVEEDNKEEPGGACVPHYKAESQGNGGGLTGRSLCTTNL